MVRNDQDGPGTFQFHSKVHSHFWMGGLAGSLINCFRVELMGFFSHLRCTCLVGITSFLVFTTFRGLPFFPIKSPLRLSEVIASINITRLFFPLSTYGA